MAQDYQAIPVADAPSYRYNTICFNLTAAKPLMGKTADAEQLTGDHSGTTNQLETKEPDISLRNLHRPKSQLTCKRVNIELRSGMLMCASAGVQ